ISYLIHGKGDGFQLSYIPNIDVIVIFKVVFLAALCGLLSTVIVLAFSQSSKLAGKLIPNPYVRIFVGGLIIIGLSILFPSGNYNGSGTAMINDAIQGNTESYAFIVKLLFTAITLGFGFKGGEIIPTFFVGATFGCLVGSVIGIDPGFAAAIGLVATFCGAVNCPLTSIFLSIELFGVGGLIYFAISVAISYVFSGYYSLYSSQKIVYSKIKAEYINIDSLH
ncbi:MAG: chloride channel protein, partial [Anaerovoracaceae bacterium]